MKREGEGERGREREREREREKDAFLCSLTSPVSLYWLCVQHLPQEREIEEREQP